MSYGKKDQLNTTNKIKRRKCIKKVFLIYTISGKNSPAEMSSGFQKKSPS